MFFVFPEAGLPEIFDLAGKARYPGTTRRTGFHGEWIPDQVRDDGLERV